MSKGKRISPKKIINIPIDALASYVSQKYNFKGLNITLYSSCTTGIDTLDYAIDLIDEYDYVIVGASDHGCNPLDLTLFSTLGALSTKSSPFDDERNGFVMGDGSGVMVLESEEKAIKRNATIHACLYKAGHASDAFNRTTPSGEGAITSMVKAIKNAGQPKINYVNAHATSTPAGDEVEYNSIMSVLPSAKIFSNKGKIGHTMGAAGVIETIYSIEAIKHQIIPHNHNFKSASYDTVGAIIHTPINIKSNHEFILNNSFGFGGKCSSQIIEVLI
jgi:3-oxoacyl-[acyl-carrier-protein] synthase II